ncbi:MAG: YqhA family protein [Cyanobacteria bacterium SZAS LIN-3]|nr:YqhA family protein [Cyanobacteria bacterium SZAS LIN-3]
MTDPTKRPPGSEDASPPPGPKKERTFCSDNILFQSRWLLYPINLGLMLALAVYLGRFVVQVAGLLWHAPALVMSPPGEDHELMVAIVGLLDQAMICSLLIMTIMGGHQIYVRRFKEELTARGPYWLKRVDTIVLKVKLGLAFMGVSSVVLLKDCVSATVVPREVWLTHVVIHIVFLGTTIITAFVWRIMHPQGKTD